ncbi:MAG TPA: hypothetical protein VE152_03025 [Acidimicrobiales bacterium]|nr:hypothetical protein [Acidimicrobiales bacterium]
MSRVGPPAGALPRLLTIMGSGETAPTMARVHRDLISRLGSPPVPAVLLDTPFGFQENADDLCARAQAYFRDSVGADLEIASLRSATADRVAEARWLARVGTARYVFAGPGSPSYALRHWDASGLPAELREKLRAGGGVTFASAAALTLGTATVPVYEIYKVGEDPHWLPGLDLLAEAGLHAAVIPHFDNAEGGTHDTRYCYLGERRLSRMEGQLGEGVFVLGVDEHTGLVLDLGEGSASVVGLGGVTVRAARRSHRLPAGTTVPITELAERAVALATGPGPSAPATPAPGAGPEATAGAGGPARPCTRDPTSPLLSAVRHHQEAFSAALADREVVGVVRAVLALADELVAWSRDSLQSDESDRGRDALHAMVATLGDVAEVGARDPATVVGPFVEALVDARARARADRRYGEADRLREQLATLGVEVRDTPQGTHWLLSWDPRPGPGG